MITLALALCLIAGGFPLSQETAAAPPHRESILSRKTNLIFSYRAEWREDLIVLVYVPSVREFVCYQRGY